MFTAAILGLTAIARSVRPQPRTPSTLGDGCIEPTNLHEAAAKGDVEEAKKVRTLLT